jgi:uncharacterized damage-inducible protein DinB
MPLRDALLPEFDHEMSGLRQLLERIPEDRFGWKPHAKSFDLVSLAAHLANMPLWLSMTLAHDRLDLAPGGRPMPQLPVPADRAELLARFDGHLAEARAALAAAEDGALTAPWSLLMDGRPLFTLPRMAVLRTHVLSHAIHHRGQLTVYLRLLDVPLPALYGPTADEGAMG